MAPAMLFAVLRPRSFWQCVEMITLSAPGVFALIFAMSSPNSCGRFQPVVSVGCVRVGVRVRACTCVRVRVCVCVCVGVVGAGGGGCL
jgi:hypothetical protein